MSRPALRLLHVATVLLLAAMSVAAPAGHAATGPPAAPVQLDRQIQIYPLGDSITVGICNDCPRRESPGGYRASLDSLLTQSRITHLFVGTSVTNRAPTLKLEGQEHHEGHSGFRVGQLTTGVEGWLAGDTETAPIDPDIVIIHAGTNDILQRFDPGYRYPTKDLLVDFTVPWERATFVSHLTTRIQTLVDTVIQARPSARIVLSSLAPIEESVFEPVTSMVATAVERIVNDEQAQQHRVYFADVFHAFIQGVKGQPTDVPGLMSSGGVHPSPAGYAVMAHVYRAAVVQVLATWPMDA